MKLKLIRSDCLLALRMMPANSIDSIVTDPPYGLSDHRAEDVADCLAAWLRGEEYKPKKRGFMGHSWDAWVPGPEVWRECLRVLKPGGHIAAFAGSRTADLMSMAIRLAGFECRDVVMWVYGSGFPKSLDVSKAIDKAAGYERATEYEPNYKNSTFGKAMGGGKSGAQSDPPVTDAARQWQGWGTALKPAYEPIILARKPLAGTVAENVLQHGTGAINVDGCRVEGWKPQVTQGVNSNPSSFNVARQRRVSGDSDEGRWPANLCHDGSEEVLAGFPRSSGGAWPASGAQFGYSGGERKQRGERKEMADTGSAARFFYCAKASKADRDEGLDHLQPTSAADMVQREEGSAGMGNPRAGAGRTGGARNFHPTVKPTELMRWVCRLITPPGGVVLDPFMGSGSTGKAAALEGFAFTGIELSQDYWPIAHGRITAARGSVEVRS